MRKIRMITVLLTLTSCLVLFSTGFATWYPLNLSPTNIFLDNSSFGQISVYSAAGVADYIELGLDGKQIFQYNIFSFWKDGDFSNSGDIKLTYHLDIPVLEAALAEKGKSLADGATIHLSLTYGNLFLQSGESDPGLFKQLTGDSGTKSVTATVGGQAAACTPSTDGTELVVTYKFTESEFSSGKLTAEGDLVFDVVVTLNVPSNNGTSANFRNNFGKYLKSGENGTFFTTSAYIEELT